MPIPERFLDELTERNDIVDVVSQYVRLTKRTGANLFGLCPFHSEKTPSFSVNRDRQIYHCFGCGKGGGVINFIMEVENLDFPDAVAFLARRANMPMPEEAEGEDTSRRKRLLELNKEAARFFYAQLVAPTGRPAQEYVNRRQISPAMVRAFGLGYAPDSWSALTDAMRQKGYSDQDLFDAGLMKHGRNGGGYDAFRNRLMFPVIDVRGSVIGFSGRILGDGEPKYLNSPETPVFSKSHNLFALNLAKKSKSGYIILTEGNIDVVSLHQAGFDSAVASLGTSLTAEQARLISRYVSEVVLCYDSDEAGRKAAQRGISILQKLDLKVRVLQVPGAKDPDEFIKKNGADAFRNLLEASEGQVEYRLKLIEEQHPPLTDEGKVDYFKAAAALLSALPSQVEREVYSARVAEKAAVSRQAVADEVERLRKRRLRDARKKEEREQTRPSVASQPTQRGIRYDDPRSARAEEGVIRLLYLDPGLARNRELPAPESFSSPLLGRFYGELLHRIQAGERISLGVLAGRFTPEEMSHFTSVVDGTEDLSNADRALNDYIRIIAGRSEEQEDDLRALAEKYRKTKSYGG
ncbi:MAG: DNA primase [Oscillospiraceae bacterium]|nr:DNA primase [Oscillospiraceae bacterium]